MAWFEHDARSGFYRIRFRYAGRKYNLSQTLKITDEGKAHATCEVVDDTIKLLGRGLIAIPEGVDAGEFIVSGGRLTSPVAVVPPPEAVTLKCLFDAYIGERADVGGREGTIATENIHIAHLKELLVLLR